MTQEVIMKMVTSAIDAGSLGSKSRKDTVKNQRAYLMMYLKDNTDMSLDQIGSLFNRDSHGTVINAIKMAREKLGKDDNIFYNDVAFLNLYIKTIEMKLKNLEKTLETCLEFYMKKDDKKKVKSIKTKINKIKKEKL